MSPKVDAPRLQLAREARPAAVGGSCVTVGPFATNELAARARQTLNDSGYPSLPREEATQLFEGYWVYLESPPTESGERRLLDRLEKGRHHRCRGNRRTGFASCVARRFLG